MYGLLYWSIITSTPIPVSATVEDLSFNGYGLQNSNIKSLFEDPFASGSVSYNTSDVPQDDGKIYQSRFWREKTFKIKGIIVCDTQTLLEAKIDEIKKNIAAPEGLLKYKRWNGTYREIHCTLVNEIIKREHFNIDWISFEFEFKTNDPFWRDSIQDNRIYSWITSNLLESITNTGSESSPPQTYFSFLSASWTTSVAITLQWRTITWTGGITTGDLLVIDCLNKEVRKNNIIQDYTWTFQKLVVGVNPITYTIDGAFSCDISTLFYNYFR